ncbi:MAG: M20/M25/M40 family metallo-hydrolase [Spirochaetia bacterium]
MKNEIINRFSRGITIPTVSCRNYDKIDRSIHRKFLEFLEESYPAFHGNIGRIYRNDFGVIYRWKGTGSEKKPLLLAAHYDVVEVDPADESKWDHPPFSGHFDGTYVWGRGAQDDKNNLLGIMEGATALLEQGFRPERDIYFAFGGDEETTGTYGAGAMAEFLRNQGVKFAAVLDEGSLIAENMLQGVTQPLALISVAEKAFVNYRIKAVSGGGHSAMPPKHTALGNLARAITLIEGNPLPPKLILPVKEFLKSAAAGMKGIRKFLLSNPSIFRSFILKALAKYPATNALIRTTAAATMAKASNAANVLPQNAEAVINVRLLPGDSAAETARQFRKICAGIPGITIEPEFEGEEIQVPVSPGDSEIFRQTAVLLKELVPECITAPFLMTGTTDSKYYAEISDAVYRVSPMKLNQEELDRIHGAGERLSMENYQLTIRFFEEFIKRSQKWA